MREMICRNCGYRNMEKDMFDYVTMVPMYPNSMVDNILPYMQSSFYDINKGQCPECGKYYNK